MAWGTVVNRFRSIDLIGMTQNLESKVRRNPGVAENAVARKSTITDKARVRGRAAVTNSHLSDNADVFGEARVHDAHLVEHAQISGHARVANVTLRGHVHLGGYAAVEKDSHYATWTDPETGTHWTAYRSISPYSLHAYVTAIRWGENEQSLQETDTIPAGLEAAARTVAVDPEHQRRPWADVNDDKRGIFVDRAAMAPLGAFPAVYFSPWVGATWPTDAGGLGIMPLWTLLMLYLAVLTWRWSREAEHSIATESNLERFFVYRVVSFSSAAFAVAALAPYCFMPAGISAF